MILTSVTITFFEANNTMGGRSSHHLQGQGILCQLQAMQLVNCCCLIYTDKISVTVEDLRARTKYVDILYSCRSCHQQ